MNKFKMLAYSGAVIDAPPFWGRVVIDVKGMKAKSKLPALREHMRDRVVGTITGTRKNGSNFHAEGFFSETTADGRECRGLLAEGHPFECSIGVFASKVERVSKDEIATVNGRAFRGPGSIWRESNVGEISFVAIGVDRQTNVEQIAASAAGRVEMTAEMEFAKKFEKEITPDPNAPDVEVARRAVKVAEDEGIPVDEATEKVLAADAELAGRYFETFHK